MIRKTLVIAAWLMAPIAAYAASSNTDDQIGPAPLAKNFMAQFYNVNPDAVAVTVLEERPQLTVLRAEVDEHACRMEMAPAPTGITAGFGWLARSIQCDQR